MPLNNCSLGAEELFFSCVTIAEPTHRAPIDGSKPTVTQMILINSSGSQTKQILMMYERDLWGKKNDRGGRELGSMRMVDIYCIHV